MVGYVASAIAGVMVVGLATAHVGWWWRTLVFLPAALAATGFLQASRGTCVAHAARGTFEHDDLSTTPAPEDDVAASRRVAAAIRRDAIIVGFVAATVSAATSLLM